MASARRGAPKEQYQSFPAPVGGWIANQNLATPSARRPDGSKVNGAAVLDNFVVTATSIRTRGGSARYAFLGDGSGAVTALFKYINGNNRKFFASTAVAIYDITSVLYAEDQFLEYNGKFVVDDDGNFVVLTSSPDPEVDALTGGSWSVVQFATSGGTFLRAVNGVDTPRIYDGTVWDTDPAITGTGLDPTTLSFGWPFKNRLFFIQKDSLDAWYLSVDAIGGAATKLPLGGVFTLGGSLMFGAAWSLDSGDGLNEQWVVVTTEGEAAVFQGSNPSDAADWKKVGVYKIGKPRGPKAFIRAGGDIVICTDIGYVALSTAIQRDVSALAPAAISYPIEDAWNVAVAERSIGWHTLVWPTRQMVLVALPTVGSQTKTMFIANARTGAWSRFTGWGATCMEEFGDSLFFGTDDGRVIEGEVAGSDQGAPFTAVCVPLFDPLKSPASLKTGLQARVMYRAPTQVAARLSLQADYNVRLPPAPNDNRTGGNSVWGSGKWGESKWGSAAEKRTFNDWKSVSGSGYALSIASQYTSGGVSPLDVEVVQTDLTFEQGAVGS